MKRLVLFASFVLTLFSCSVSTDCECVTTDENGTSSLVVEDYEEECSSLNVGNTKCTEY